MHCYRQICMYGNQICMYGNQIGVVSQIYVLEKDRTVIIIPFVNTGNESY